MLGPPLATKKKEILNPGTQFGRYRIERRIGSGGMGAVYEATHTGLGKRVAIKALLPEMASEPEIQVRFLREGESAARIQHPHVVDIYDVGTQDDITYLVMEYLDGKDLAAVLRKKGSLSIQEATDIMLPVSAALMTAHEKGVIHRDLKPANIFLADGPHGQLTPKVLDFGISKLKTNSPSEELTTTGALLGTPFYMSPEQAAGSKSLDARSDQYSLGVILYQCVTGKKPFEADSMYKILHRIVQGEFEPPRNVRPELPPEFERVLLTMMATKAERRFPTLNEVGKALLPFASGPVRARWEPIFGAQLASADLPSTYKQPAVAFAEPIGGITHANHASTLRQDTRARPAKALIAAGVAMLVIAAAVIAMITHERPAPIQIETLAAPELAPPPQEPAPPPPPAVEPTEAAPPPVVEAPPPPRRVKKKPRPAKQPAKEEAGPKRGANDSLIIR
jgi:serine/threonine-protein kinase